MNNKTKKKIGMITPSSNTTLEPVCSHLLGELEECVTIHYTRLKVKDVTLERKSKLQFQTDKILYAAELLCDANVDVIAWNGTSGSWIGYEQDLEYCDLIKKNFGIPATTSTLAQISLLKKLEVKSMGLITPYTQDINERIIHQYKQLGIHVSSAIGLNVTDSCSIADIPSIDIQHAIDKVCIKQLDALNILCTNMAGIKLVDYVEKNKNVILIDSVATTLYETLCLIGISPTLIQEHGKLFSLVFD